MQADLDHRNKGVNFFSCIYFMAQLSSLRRLGVVPVSGAGPKGGTHTI